MARNLTTDLNSAVQASEVHPVLLAKINTSGGDVLVWNGIGDISFGGDTYLGTGTFGGISPVQEKTDLSASGITYSLSGIPASMVSTALGQVQQGRSCQLFLGALNITTGALIADPYELFAGFTDVTVIEENADTATISISAENRLIDLERPRVRRYTDEDQKSEYSTDVGFEFVPSLQDKVIVFGKN